VRERSPQTRPGLSSNYVGEVECGERNSSLLARFAIAGALNPPTSFPDAAEMD
jgi:hypothetical protein